MNKPIEPPSPFEIEESYSLEHARFDVNGALIIKALSGSHAYGMAQANSDIDIRGVFVSPLQERLRLDRETKVIKSAEGQGDLVYHEIQSFFRLCCKMESNSIQLLFTPEYAILEIDEFGQMLLKNREMFLNQRCRFSFGGFAFSVAKQAVNPKSESHPDFRQKHGYDTKMAMNAIRINRMAIELLSSGKITMTRPDAQELLDIRNGKYSSNEFAVFEKRLDDKGKPYDELVGGIFFDEYTRMLTTYETTKLPLQPEVERINALLRTITLGKLGITLPHERER
jgi:RNA repair pathway DNA polymerase beta family